MNFNNGDHLPFHLEAETEGERSPCPIEQFTRMRDQSMFARAKRFHARQIREMSPEELRFLKGFLEFTVREFAEKARAIGWHLRSEPEVPEYLRAEGAI